MMYLIDLQTWWNDLIKFFQNNGTDILMRTLIALLVLIGGHYLIKLFIAILRKASRIKKSEVDRSARAFVISLVGVLLRFGLAIIVLLILNVNLAGLASIISAGVLAIGLSLQDLIGNLAAGVTLLTSKPFVTGDFIAVADKMGSVRRVGLIHTALDTPDNQRILVPNKFIINNAITNYSLNVTRRGQVRLNFSYEYEPDMIKNMFTELINKEERILESPAPSVVVFGFNEYGFEVIIRFYTHVNDYWDTLFVLNEAVIKTLKDNKITPSTRTWLVHEHRNESD
ncbi:MAG: mechanosensitive ion channel family protein [Bacilli bacterium]|nr:mechanosensitive ion channel family protein [Bacilli bacterium]